MKILLDECVPEPMHALLKHLLVGHEVGHVNQVGWRGKKDIPLLTDSARRGYRMFVTNNIGQFNDPKECDAIRRSKMHHVTYETDDGLDGLGRAAGALCAALRGIVTDLEPMSSQRLARVIGLRKGTKRYVITDPTTDPPSNYWP